MAISGKKIMFLGVLMAVLLAVATEGAVTVYNPASIPVGVLVDGERVQVESSGIFSIDITDAEQKINITNLAGDSILALDVTDRDIIILYPEVFVGNAPASVRVVPVPGDFSLAGGEPQPPP